jgi:hypothetical protein
MSNSNDSDRINVDPVPFITSQQINSISVAIDELILFTSAVIRVTSYDAVGNRIKFDRIPLTGQDYTDWANNDQYIYNYVYSKLNLTPLPTTTG